MLRWVNYGLNNDKTWGSYGKNIDLAHDIPMFSLSSTKKPVPFLLRNSGTDDATVAEVDEIPTFGNVLVFYS